MRATAIGMRPRKGIDMGRSVSVPHNAQVVAYQWHDSYCYCWDCDQKVEDDTCPNDHSGHDVEMVGDKPFCYDCDQFVGEDWEYPHSVSWTSDWGDDPEEFLDYVRYGCKEYWPSLEKADRWIGREDHVVLENWLVDIGVSSYCGVVAVWIVPTDNPETRGLAWHWVDQIRDRFLEMFGQMRRIGHFSNGNAVYEKVKEG